MVKKNDKIIPREARTGRFITLKDGRKIAEPPRGGLFTKEQIRSAVLQVRDARLSAEAG